MIYDPQSSSGMFGRLDDLHLSRRERLHINAYIHDGERIADISTRALAGIRSGALGVAHGVKAMFATPARH
ncbi:MAG: hypothetical protein IH606_07435 [Burkholderiales bacterium]|nr:hypothetical protein [Burkholderiales bacterium]